MSERGFNHRDRVLIRVLLLRSGVFKHSSGSHPGANAHGHDAVRPAARKTQERNSESRCRQQTMSVCAAAETNLFPLRLSSLSSVTTCRAPVQPRGWPRAMAPPLGFTFSSGMPNFSTQYTAWAAAEGQCSQSQNRRKKHFYLKQKAKFTWCQKISLFSCLSVTFEPVWYRTEPFYGSLLCNIE